MDRLYRKPQFDFLLPDPSTQYLFVVSTPFGPSTSSSAKPSKLEDPDPMASCRPRRRRRRKEEDIPDWASLPTDLLALVAEKLCSVVSYLRFRAVCRRWRSISASGFSPLLLLEFNPATNSLPVFDPSDSKVYSVHLPELHGKAFLNPCSHGWISLIDESDDLYLFNPFTRAQLRLPSVSRELAQASGVLAQMDIPRVIIRFTNPFSLYSKWKTFIAGVTLSCSPSSGADCLVLAKLPNSSKIVFCRLGDSQWNVLDTGLPGVNSIAYCEGRIYAVNSRGAVVSCCIGSPWVAEQAAPIQLTDQYRQFSILAVGKELLLIGYEELSPIAFCLVGSQLVRNYVIFRSGVKGRLEWSRVNSIEDMALFISCGYTLNTICGRFSWCANDAIYFSQPITRIYTKRSGHHCIQVMNLAHGCSEIVSCRRKVELKEMVSWLIPHLS